MDNRQDLHKLIDHIPAADVPAARKFLRAMIEDPVELALLTAPIDDEPEDDEERAAVAEALSDLAPSVPFEQIRQVRV